MGAAPMSQVVNPGRADLWRLFVNSDVHLAPDATFRAALLAGVPFTFAFGLDPGAVDQPQQALDQPGCRLSAMPNNTFRVSQVRMAAPLSSGNRARLPVSAASRIMEGSSQIASEPRRFRASSQAGPFPVLQAVGVALVLPTGSHTGVTR